MLYNTPRQQRAAVTPDSARVLPSSEVSLSLLCPKDRPCWSAQAERSASGTRGCPPAPALPAKACDPQPGRRGGARGAGTLQAWTGSPSGAEPRGETRRVL